MCVTFFISSPANRRSIAEKRGRLNGARLLAAAPRQLLDGLCQKLTNYESSFQKRCAWTNKQAGRNRFVILKNEEVEIIAEDDDEYVAVFVIIPEDCRNPEEIKQIFPRYVTLLRTALAEMYPGHILKRINSQHAKAVG